MARLNALERELPATGGSSVSLPFRITVKTYSLFMCVVWGMEGYSTRNFFSRITLSINDLRGAGYFDYLLRRGFISREKGSYSQRQGLARELLAL
jgi:hypothetical protein